MRHRGHQYGGRTLQAGLILKDGAFDRGADSPYLRMDENQIWEFIVVPAENTQDGRPVTFTQNDVRAIQLAKGALRTGIDLLCKEAGMELPTKAIGGRSIWQLHQQKGCAENRYVPAEFPKKISTWWEMRPGPGPFWLFLTKNILTRANELTRSHPGARPFHPPGFSGDIHKSLAFPDK